MSTAQITKRIAQSAPRVGSRFIGIYYLLTIVTGAFVLSFHGRLAFVVDLVVTVGYLAMTAFLYGLSASANNSSRSARKEGP
ncbi:MAG TPA: hypothetical protein VNS62_12810 [Candidatus Udaeobacter sp.]|nr:hypothetical protein [Candidatus Udaeobacter sp.]